jgi:hypothetical protein
MFNIEEQVLFVREQALMFLKDTCKIRYPTGTDVVDGEDVTTWSPFISTACRFIVRSGTRIQNSASQERVVAFATFIGQYRMQLPFDAYIDEGDQIEYEGRIFEVTYVPPRHKMMGAFVIGLEEAT